MNIPIFLSSDNNYAPFVATTIASICDNTNSFCEFYILDGGITADNREKICKLKNKFNNFSIEFIKIDLEKYFNNFIEKYYFTKSMYNRFLIPTIKPNIDKAIYLDVDIIVLNDIKKLYDEYLDDYMLGAVPDYGSKKEINKFKSNINLREDSVYFNSGVLLLDCKKWRDKNIFEKLLRIEETNRDILKMPDQDILNIYFEQNFKILDLKYNLESNNENNNYNKNEVVIRHYNTPTKPWDIDPTICIYEYEDFNRFWEYLKMTVFYEDLIQNCKNKTIHNLNLLRLITKLSKERNS